MLHWTERFVETLLENEVWDNHCPSKKYPVKEETKTDRKPGTHVSKN